MSRQVNDDYRAAVYPVQIGMAFKPPTKAEERALERKELFHLLYNLFTHSLLM